MDEVEGVYNGTYDYTQLKGDTGPLVYPGGFVVVYYPLYLITNFGENIYLAQYIFMALYLANIILVCFLYKNNKIVSTFIHLFTLDAILGNTTIMFIEKDSFNFCTKTF